VTPMVLMATLALGGLGAVVRFGVKEALNRNGDHRLATVLVNVLGSSLAGGLAALPVQSITQILIIGFAGALTTFSTLALQLTTKEPTDSWWSRPALALVHIVGAIGACWLTFLIVTLALSGG
jgi:fluoride exporter